MMCFHKNNINYLKEPGYLLDPPIIHSSLHSLLL